MFFVSFVVLCVLCAPNQFILITKYSTTVFAKNICGTGGDITTNNKNEHRWEIDF